MGPRWLSWHLHKGVAQTLADALDGDLGVAVVVAVVVAYSYLHNKEVDAGVSKVEVCSSTDQHAMVQRRRRLQCLSMSVRVAYSPACCGTARERSDASGLSRNTRSLRCRTLS